jgi:hypothetical protein
LLLHTSARPCHFSISRRNLPAMPASQLGYYDYSKQALSMLSTFSGLPLLFRCLSPCASRAP